MVNLDSIVRKVPDFPKPGVLFYDLTPLLVKPVAFQMILEQSQALCRAIGFDGIIAPESRGFLFAAPMALACKVPLVLARKPGKLPGKTVSQCYQLEYGEAALEIQHNDLTVAKRWLIVDDLIATGGTIKAVADLMTAQRCVVAGVFALIGLPALGYQQQLSEYSPKTLINY